MNTSYAADHDLAKRHFGEALKYDPDCPEAKAEFTKVGGGGGQGARQLGVHR